MAKMMVESLRIHRAWSFQFIRCSFVMLHKLLLSLMRKRCKMATQFVQFLPFTPPLYTVYTKLNEEEPCFANQSQKSCKTSFCTLAGCDFHLTNPPARSNFSTLLGSYQATATARRRSVNDSTTRRQSVNHEACFRKTS